MADILIVDDEKRVLEAFKALLADLNHHVRTASSGEAALPAIEDNPPDLLVMDIHLGGMTGLEVFEIVHEKRPNLPVIIMTAYSTTDRAIQATKMGAFDYQLKPFDPEKMLTSIENALDCRRIEGDSIEFGNADGRLAEQSIVGDSPAMQEVYKTIGRVAGNNATVLIRGETGTGKELITRAIHEHSPRSEGPLVMVNCAAIPETLLEDELFGHEKGAFTGARETRIGKFERAKAGTLFLDEIGEMPTSTQVKILRALQERKIERVGGSELIPVDVRVIAATNRDLEVAIREGNFREDLYHRLNVLSVTVPPLRERRDDIVQLVHHFISLFSEQLGFQQATMSAEGMKILRQYSWPGNVRELEHCIKRLLVYTRGYPIRKKDVEHVLNSDEGVTPVEGESRQQQMAEVVKDYLSTHAGDNAHSIFMDLVDRAMVAAALEMADENRTGAAKLLGVSRATLHAKLRKYELG